MNGSRVKKLRRGSQASDVPIRPDFRALKKAYTRTRSRGTPPKAPYRGTRRSRDQMALAARQRGTAVAHERRDILKRHPELAKPWMPIENLRRKSRALG